MIHLPVHLHGLPLVLRYLRCYNPLLVQTLSQDSLRPFAQSCCGHVSDCAQPSSDVTLSTLYVFDTQGVRHRGSSETTVTTSHRGISRAARLSSAILT